MGNVTKILSAPCHLFIDSCTPLQFANMGLSKAHYRCMHKQDSPKDVQYVNSEVGRGDTKSITLP